MRVWLVNRFSGVITECIEWTGAKVPGQFCTESSVASFEWEEEEEEKKGAAVDKEGKATATAAEMSSFEVPNFIAMENDGRCERKSKLVLAPLMYFIAEPATYQKDINNKGNVTLS
jgi:hypothetical protein